MPAHAGQILFRAVFVGGKEYIRDKGMEGGRERTGRDNPLSERETEHEDVFERWTVTFAVSAR